MCAKTAASAANDATIYLDNAATTFPKPEGVYRAADEFYRRFGGNAGRGNNPLARACARLVDETRARLAAWLGASAAEAVIFTASATHALNLALFGQAWRAGDFVYVTPFEHNSVLRPIEHLRQTQGVQVRRIPFQRRTYACELEKLAARFQIEPPTLVCVTQASNVCGVMPPVVEIARLAKAANPAAIVLVDGAQTAGLYPLPLQDGLIDALIFSGHKALYGPYGIAGLVLGSAWQPNPLLFGGTGTFSERLAMPDNGPSRYEAGSHNIWAIAGLHAALEWLQTTGRTVIVEQTMQLAHHLQTELAQIAALDLFVPPPTTPWCGILSFTLADITPQAVETALGAQNIAVRAGLHCAPWAHEWLGTQQGGGTVRVSPTLFNTTDEIGLVSNFLRQVV